MSRVLVIDDTPTVLAYCTTLLAAHEVHTASDWVEANRIAHAVKPDVIVLDENLGAFQGSYLVRAFRMFFGGALPLVLISSDDCAAASEASGANAFVNKEYLDQLPAVLELVLRCTAGDECTLTVTPEGPVCQGPTCSDGGPP